MNTKPNSGPAEHHARHDFPTTQLLQSRETAELGPAQTRYVSSIAVKPVPVAKSWAHFVAGG